MSAKKFICPFCNESFKTRKLAKGHLIDKKHPGAVIVEEATVATEVTTTKPMTPRRGKYKCPECKKTSKTWKGIQDHMASKKHTGTPAYQEKVSKGAKKEPKPEPKPEPKEEPAPIIDAYIRILPSIIPAIQEELTEDMEIIANPENNNVILKYTNYSWSVLDMLMFQHQFVSMELENSDLVLCLSLLNPEREMIIYDQAEMKTYGTKGVEDGIIIMDFDVLETTSVSTIVGGLIEANPNLLACVSGIWKKVWTRPTPVTKPVEAKPVEKTEEVKIIPPIQKKIEDFDDWDVMRYASEWGGRSLHGLGTTYKPQPIAPPKPLAYPVYGVTEKAIVVDRLFEYKIYE